MLKTVIFLDGKYFVFRKKHLRSNLNASQYQIWTSVPNLDLSENFEKVVTK